MTNEVLATEQLHRKGHHDDFGPSSVDSSEAVHVAGAQRSLYFQLVGVLHHGNCVVGVGIGNYLRISQLFDDGRGVFVSPFSHEPPGRRRAETDDSE